MANTDPSNEFTSNVPPCSAPNAAPVSPVPASNPAFNPIVAPSPPPSPHLETLEKTKKKMETTYDQLVEALYQKGLALVEVASLKVKWLHFLQTWVQKSWINLMDSLLQTPGASQICFKRLPKSCRNEQTLNHLNLAIF
uniref:uncharacterized protein LOC122584892 n=1 Tax=Erigeron canadensis TaxID=72917 RepID=UPI001CB9A799|nr:uncharacterized protein LOC122584892 [Erigeron canadensis]XP_043612902.1 uncharacterized protein LOC122584892 [Erigeron canadensis]XP_043612903.1 uncharacterized protein LOC122584892 [Erigeron canadensis]